MILRVCGKERRTLNVQPLYEYQQAAIDFLLHRLYDQDQGGAALWLDPGLGKTRITLEALSFLHAVGVATKTLIVAPLRVCELVWPQEVEKWEIPLTIGSIHSKRRLDTSLTLVNPESMHKIEPGQFDCLVVDESTKFKTWSTKRMKLMRKLLPTFAKRILLSGTPAANSLADLHAQMFCVDFGDALGRNVTVFRAMYMRQVKKLNWNQWEIRKDKEEQIMDLIAPLCLRMSAEDYLDMPELVTNRVMCRLPADAMREYKRLKAELLAQLETGDVLAMNAASAYGKMRQLANGQLYDSERSVHFAHDRKLAALGDLRDELGGKPLLVFFQFKHDAAAILGRHKDAVVLAGGTKRDEAKEIVDAWNDGSISMLLIQPQSASHGLNLQYGPCADVAWYGLHASPEVVDQANRRLYRNGQKNRQIRVHRLLCEDTLEITMEERLAGKYRTQEEFFKALLRHARNG